MIEILVEYVPELVVRILAPFLISVLVAYWFGRSDGARAERNRRLHAAEHLLARKQTERAIRL